MFAPVLLALPLEWYKKYGNQHDLAYTGPLSFMHLPDASHAFDIAILGFPFDTTTSYRPGATAIDQMEVAYSTLLARPVQGETKSSTAAYGQRRERNTRVLPILRSLHKVYGPISAGVEGRVDQERISHGSYFTIAAEENLLSNTSIHGGIRQKMGGRAVVEHDESVGFQLISSEDIDDYGIQSVIQKIRDRVGMGPVYLTLDIDVIDPGMAPASKYWIKSAGGWTTREVNASPRGCDIVEVAPAYDHAEMTSRAAAGIVDDFLQMLQADAPPKPRGGPFWDDD
ncbi:arginase deacetylase [Mycena olivaceomarginata]|nr:arginase deacetylase [Mycena olivaceomarginata]